MNDIQSGPTKSRLLRTLDRYTADLQAGRVSKPIMTPIACALAGYRKKISNEEWRETICHDLRPHPIIQWLHEDPYSAHGFRKPRGYAGDAELLDFIYDRGVSREVVGAASPTGAALYRECLSHPAFAAIRQRRNFLSERLAALCQSGGRPHILSVACGHLREAEPLTAATPSGRFVALDQVPVTLQVVMTDHSSLPIEPVQASVLTLLHAGRDLGTFDFIYSAGLYDYLSDDVARRLTAKLVTMLTPTGRLLIANMLPSLPSAAYMEAVMDWWLTYRTMTQFKSLAGRAAGGERVTACQQHHVAYVEIGKGVVS